jgi:hypothetical protein
MSTHAWRFRRKAILLVIFMVSCLSRVGCQVCDPGFCTAGTADRERDEAASAAQLLGRYANWHSQVRVGRALSLSLSLSFSLFLDALD